MANMVFSGLREKLLRWPPQGVGVSNGKNSGWRDDRALYRFTFEGFLRILGVMWPSLLLMWVPGILLRPQMMALSAQMASQNYSGLRELWPVCILSIR